MYHLSDSANSLDVRCVCNRYVLYFSNCTVTLLAFYCFFCAQQCLIFSLVVIYVRNLRDTVVAIWTGFCYMKQL